MKAIDNCTPFIMFPTFLSCFLQIKTGGAGGKVDKQVTKKFM